MSIVQTEIPGSRVLDLCAGTGALGLEALSRGATYVDFVENDPRSLRVLEENIAGLDAGGRCRVHRADAMKFVAKSIPKAWSLAFADPPYRRGLARTLALLWLETRFSTIFGVEHGALEVLPEGGDRRRYGDTAVTIYRT